MKKTVLFLAMLLAAVSQPSVRAQFRTDYRTLSDSEPVAGMRSAVGFLASAALEGRKAGSEGEKEAARFISETLASYGVDVLSGTEGEIFGMKTESGDTLVSRNVTGFIPGYDRELRGHYIVIGARLDNIGTLTVNRDGVPERKICYGANGNASGLAMLMQLARMLQTNSVLLKRSVLICAFGSSLNLGGGSWYMLNRSFADAGKIDAMINLDMLGTPSRGFYAYTASNVDLNRRLASMGETLQPILPEVVSLEPVNSDHRSFYDKEIPAVLFTTGMYPEYNSDRDTPSILEYGDMERELEYIYNFSLSLANGPRPEFRVADESGKRYTEAKDVVSYSDCDYKPSFFNSIDPSVFMNKWVYVYLRYPRYCVENGIQGRVLVDFIIDEKGKVRDVKVIRGVHPDLDAEAVRVISASPDWKPARVRGKKVKCEMSLYVEFKLEKKKR